MRLSNIHVTATHYLGRYLAPTYNEGDCTACTDCVGMWVSLLRFVNTFLQANSDKSSFVTVNPERCDNRSAIVPLRPTTVNSAFRFFCSTALPHTRQQRFTMVRADTLLDSTVIMAFLHDHIEGAWQRRLQLQQICHMNHSAIWLVPPEPSRWKSMVWPPQCYQALFPVWGESLGTRLQG